MACGDLPDCCITLSGAVDPLCCDGNFATTASSVVIALVNTDNAPYVCDLDTGNFVQFGTAWTGNLDATGCFTSCPLRVNSAHDQPTAYTVIIRVSGQVVYQSGEIYIDEVDIVCGNDYNIKDFISAPPGGGTNPFCSQVLRCITDPVVTSSDGTIGVAMSGSLGTADLTIDLTVACESIQDCVGGMLAAQGFTYDDPANGFINSGLAGQTLVSDGAGGAAWATLAAGLTCEDVQDCVAPMLANVGFGYNDAANRWISTGSVGQVLTADGAGNAIWAAGGGGITQVTASTGDVNVINPLGPTVDLHIDVRIRDRYGNFGSVANNGAGTHFLDTGCGLVLDGLSELGVQVSGNWGIGPLGFACGDANGAPVYCDSAGSIRTVPEHTSTGQRAEAAFAVGVPLNSGAALTPPVFNFLVNPSPCRAMAYLAVYEGGWNYDVVAGTTYDLHMSCSGPVAGLITRWSMGTPVTFLNRNYASTLAGVATVGPAGVMFAHLDVRTGSGAYTGGTFHSGTVATTIFGVTR